jgi:hypothetical protein
MTAGEREMLIELANKIAQTPAPTHDPEADEFIRTNIGKRPDALYILTQTVLIQNLAIQHAQQELQEWKQRAAQPALPQAASSFLGGGVMQGGSRPPAPPPPEPAPTPQTAPPAGGGSSFLRSAAQTAAGVAAGALAFEGIRALFGSGSSGWGTPHFGFGGGSFLGGAPDGETIINNYYGSPEDSRDRGAGHDRDVDDSAWAAADDSRDDAPDESDVGDDSHDESDSSFQDSGYSDESGASGEDFV